MDEEQAAALNGDVTVALPQSPPVTAARPARGGGARSGATRGTQLAVAYLCAQAAAAALWWVSLRAVPEVRGWFELDPAHPRALDAFLFADVVVFVGGSAASAVAIAKAARVAPLITGLTAGGVAYASLHLLGWVVLAGAGWAGVAPMAVATVVTTAIAVRTVRSARPEPAGDGGSIGGVAPG